MNKFRQWYTTYNGEITWFIVGLLFQNTLNHLATGNLTMALVDVALAGVNIYFWKTNNV